MGLGITAIQFGCARNLQLDWEAHILALPFRVCRVTVDLFAGTGGLCVGRADSHAGADRSAAAGGTCHHALPAGDHLGAARSQGQSSLSLPAIA